MFMQAKHNSTEDCIVEQVEIARTFLKRLVGLLGRTDLPGHQGLYFPKCRSIHTFFMRFPIDILFLDKDFNITKAVSCLQPNRIALGPKGTTDVLEMACGIAGKYKLSRGDKIRLIEMACEVPHGA